MERAVNRKKDTGLIRRMHTEAEIARMYPFSRRTLQKWRLLGGRGPRWYRAAGKVLYDIDEVDEWIRSGAQSGAAP